MLGKTATEVNMIISRKFKPTAEDQAWPKVGGVKGNLKQINGYFKSTQLDNIWRRNVIVIPASNCHNFFQETDKSGPFILFRIRNIMTRINQNHKMTKLAKLNSKATFKLKKLLKQPLVIEQQT